jgi:PAS domain S-box-containing protein
MTRILIVDDHPANLHALRALLEGHGFAVTEAPDGAQALAAARHAPPDLIVADLLMPVLDGYALLRAWRADARLKPLPFLVYTATYTGAGDERLAMAMGADAFLIKPAEPQTIMAAVQRLLEGAATGTLPATAAPPSEPQALLREYNEILVAKLQKKVLEGAAMNRALRREVAARERIAGELRLRDRAIQAVSQGIVIADARQPDHPIVYAGPGFLRLTGYAAEEVLGRNCRFLQGRDTDPDVVRVLHHAIHAGEPCSVELLNYRKDGSAYWVGLSIDPVRDDAGHLAYLVGIQTDITARRQLEDELRQAHKMEAIGRLAGGVAHDFNNHLTVVSGNGEYLLSLPELPDAVREPVQAIASACEKAAALTRQLLGFSRQTVLQPVVLDLNEVVAETARLLDRVIGPQVRLRTVLGAGLSRVRADRAQLDQVLMNLAVNARDAMPQGGTLTFETADVTLAGGEATPCPDGRSGHYVRLAVSDTGIGMTPEVQARMFEPFFTTKEIGHGTGLGLSTVFGIVQQSQGSIQVVSAPGAGATFRIDLPAVHEPPAPPRAATPGAAPGGREVILLVEDDDAVRTFAVAGLTRHGYQVVTATDGQDALGVLARHAGPIDLVVTDVMMPGLTGPELMAALRLRMPDLKTLFMSGYTDDAMLREGLMDASVAFIQKPFGPRALAQKVREVLDASVAAQGGILPG